MTNKEAMKLSIEVWDWLIDHPGEYKDKAPGMIEDGSIHSCYLCDICMMNCKRCVMSKEWWGADGKLKVVCCESDTAYRRWEDAVVYTYFNYGKITDYDISFFAAVVTENLKEVYNDME